MTEYVTHYMRSQNKAAIDAYINEFMFTLPAKEYEEEADTFVCRALPGQGETGYGETGYFYAATTVPVSQVMNYPEDVAECPAAECINILYAPARGAAPASE